MLKGRNGFTVVELMVVVVVMLVITSFTTRSIAAVQAKYSSRAARDVFAGLVAQTRSHAIEQGVPTWMFASAAGDSAAIWDGGGFIGSVHFDEEFEVDLRLSNPTMVLCMTPRGYASDMCTSFSTIQKIGFQSAAELDTLMLYPLGQVRY